VSVEKFSVSLDPELGRALRSAAEAEQTTVSAWLATAIRQRLRHAALGSALDDVLAEQGWMREELLAESRRTTRKRSA
jgi:predicted transcriptional regulator